MHLTSGEIAARLPHPRDLHRVSLALAALEVVLCSDWEERWFAFDPEWDEGEEYASMHNGSGDSYHVVFSDHGVVLRGFDHESDLSPWARGDGTIAPRLLDDFPAQLRGVIDEPAFNAPAGTDPDAFDDGPVELTFCFWCVAPDDVWCVGNETDDGGAGELLAVLLDASPAAYRAFAHDYYEVELDETVDAVYRHEPMTVAMIAALNPAADAVDVFGELEEIGYPVADAAPAAGS